MDPSYCNLLRSAHWQNSRAHPGLQRPLCPECPLLSEGCLSTLILALPPTVDLQPSSQPTSSYVVRSCHSSASTVEPIPRSLTAGAAPPDRTVYNLGLTLFLTLLPGLFTPALDIPLYTPHICPCLNVTWPSYLNSNTPPPSSTLSSNTPFLSFLQNLPTSNTYNFVPGTVLSFLQISQPSAQALCLFTDVPQQLWAPNFCVESKTSTGNTPLSLSS